MTHTLKRTFAILIMAFFGSAILYNCEPEADSLGEQLFNQDATEGNETPYELIAYNIDNHDSIRSDASRLISLMNADGSSSSVGVLGAFTEGQFGMQRASYLTQLRMPSNDPDFNGANPKVDSVVLVLRVPANTTDDTYYLSDSLKTTTHEKNDFMVGNDTIPVSIEKKTYPVRKYGKFGGQYSSMKVNVHEITTFLDTNAESFKRSNVAVNTGALLGSGVFNGNISSTSITKKSDNTNVFTGNLGFRINLSNKEFFQTHILDMKGKPELKDAANFTRYFKGIRISVEETDRYLFRFSPNDLELIMYYKYDKTENGTLTRPQTSLKFNLGGANAHIGQYEYERTGSAVSTALGSINETDGDQKIFVQGMGGPSMGIKIPEKTVTDLKTLYQKDKIGIVGAKIRVYVDSFVGEDNINAENRRFTLLPNVEQKDLDFTADIKLGLNTYIYNKEKKYYDFVVTQTIKDLIEGKTDAQGNPVVVKNDPLLINLGSFIGYSTGGFVGAKYTSRAFDMYRAILIGTKDKTNPNRARLMVTYGTKK